MAGKEAKRGNVAGEGQLVVMPQGSPGAPGVQNTTGFGAKFCRASYSDSLNISLCFPRVSFSCSLSCLRPARVLQPGMAQQWLDPARLGFWWHLQHRDAHPLCRGRSLSCSPGTLQQVKLLRENQIQLKLVIILPWVLLWPIFHTGDKIIRSWLQVWYFNLLVNVLGRHFKMMQLFFRIVESFAFL